MTHPKNETFEHLDSTSMQEQLSALYDGQLSSEQAAALVHASLQDDGLFLQWRSVCAIADVLRQAQSAGVMPVVVGARAIAADMPIPTAPAANDGLFRWKMLAGFAALAAVGSMVWGLAGSQGTGGALLASNPTAAQQQLITVQTSQDAPVMIRDPRLDELLAAHKQFSGASALNQPAGSLRSASLSVNRR